MLSPRIKPLGVRLSVPGIQFVKRSDILNGPISAAERKCGRLGFGLEKIREAWVG